MANNIQGNHGDQKVMCPSLVSGMDFIRNPRLYKGMGFNLEERQGLGNIYLFSLLRQILSLLSFYPLLW